MKNDNPLLQNHPLPAFSAIQPYHIEPALDAILTENRQVLSQIIVSQPGWETVMVPWEAIEDRLEQMWAPVRHLHSVRDDPELRVAHQKCLVKLTEYTTEVLQNTKLYQLIEVLSDDAFFKTFNQAQKQVVTHALRDFRLAGVHLPKVKKQDFAKIEKGLAKLSDQFEQNVLDATQSWYAHGVDSEMLAGLPEYAIQSAREQAQKRDLPGWVITLDESSYLAVMHYASSRKLRKRVYRAFVTRASDQRPDEHQWDNSRIMARILKHRSELAKLLDFSNYAEYSLVPKMAQDSAQVFQFLNDLAKASLTKGQQEWQALLDFAKHLDGIQTLQPWDVAYYSEQLRQSQFNFSQQDLRPYFPLENVLRGLFALVEHLFGITIQQNTHVDVWHPDVRFYDIYDAENDLRGRFYLDLFARQGKRSGAWMDECRHRRRLDHAVQTPVAFLTCNFQTPLKNQPSLLTHDDVLTLFHEFGHTLHHVLTRVDYATVSGIRGVPWDAVEFPSQFMEHWAWQPDVLQMISGHYQTGQPLPDDLQNNLIASRQFQAGLRLLRQLEFALFDWTLHQEDQSDQSETVIVHHIQQTLNQIRHRVRLTPTADFDRFQHSFTHVFSGAYAAGYYSYLWAEVLASDAFAQFEEKGLMDPATGRSFLEHILEKGGSTSPEILFEAFRGRQPTIEPLLRHYGMNDESREETSRSSRT